MASFIENVEEIRERARQKIDEGPVTQSYRLDKDRAIAVLNDALATEIVCVLRYMHHYFMATGVHGRAVADEFKEHADDEREHADKLGERIQQLGGRPDLNPGKLVERSVTQYVEGETLADMIREDLVAERIVIDVYREMIRFFGNSDPTSRIMLEGILAQEEEHANDLADFLYIVDPRTGETEGQDPGTDALQMHDHRKSGRADAPKTQQRPREQRKPENEQGPPLGRAGMEASEVPGRRAGEERPQGGNARGQQVLPAHEPGSTGRPTRKRTPLVDSESAAEEERGHAGSSRSVHVTNPSRKGKKIA